MLLTIRLRNFRQHKETLIHLVPGINTIVGDNNSGKSTIPEGIDFALYGAKALRDDAKSYIRDGESNGSAVVVLKCGNDVYTVGRDSRDAEVRKNGELDAKYKNNVSAYINRLTGVNHTGFRLGHYVRQKELAAFSQLRPGKRHETVEKMLKVNAVDKAIGLIQKEISGKQIAFDAMAKGYKDVEAIDNELIDMAITLESLRNDSSNTLRDLKQLTEILTTLRTEKAAFDLATVEAKNLDESIDTLWTDYKTAQKASSDLNELLLEMSKAAQVSDDAYKVLKERVESLRTVERQSIKMLSIKQELDKPEPCSPAVVAEPVLKPDESMKAGVDLVGAKTLRDSLLKLVAGTQCPTCKQSIGETHVARVLEHAESLVTAAQPIYEAQLVLKKANAVEYEAEKVKHRAYLTTKATYEAICARRQQLLTQYVETAFDQDEQKKVEAELEKSHAARETWIKLEGKKDQLETAASKLHDLDARHMQAVTKRTAIQLVPVDIGYIAELETTETTLNDRSRTLASQVARAEGRTLELQRTVDQMTALKLAIETASVELASLKSQVDLFVLFKRHLTSKIRPLLQEVAESLFHRTTKNRYASYQLGSDYEITLTTHRGYIRKLTTISGSENDLACLCLRLAIATLRSTKLAGSLGFVILDEISGSFDDERTRQTLEGLLELREVIPQIINITHKPVEMKFADKLITVKETNGIAQIS